MSVVGEVCLLGIISLVDEVQTLFKFLNFKPAVVILYQLPQLLKELDSSTIDALHLAIKVADLFFELLLILNCLSSFLSLNFRGTACDAVERDVIDVKMLKLVLKFG